MIDFPQVRITLFKCSDARSNKQANQSDIMRDPTRAIYNLLHRIVPFPQYAHYSRAKPTNMLPNRAASPYTLGISTAGAAIDLPLPPPVVPGTLVKMVSAPVVEGVAVAVASGTEEEADEVVLYRLGSVAPQGWSTAQFVAHVLSVPQAALHCTTNSWQMKYGSVKEYSVMLGC